jgi:hypothetical protein
MNQFSKPPQTSQQPKYTPEKLAEYLKNNDSALSTNIKILTRGFEESAGVYKPWPKVEVKKSLNSILAFFNVKVVYYKGAGEQQKAQQAAEKLEELKKIFSEIDNSEEIPEGFLQRVQQVVEATIK